MPPLEWDGAFIAKSVAMYGFTQTFDSEHESRYTHPDGRTILAEYDGGGAWRYTIGGYPDGHLDVIKENDYQSLPKFLKTGVMKYQPQPVSEGWVRIQVATQGPVDMVTGRSAAKWILGALVVIALCAAFWHFFVIRPNLIPPPPESPSDVTATLDTSFENPAALTVGNIDDCNHAVTCGGVKGIEDLHKLMSSSTFAAGAYGKFDFHSARVTTLPSDVWTYVSYRIGDKLYYTKKPRLVKKGEPILEDANGMVILMRCGNVLELGPQPEINDYEPGDIYPPAVEGLPAGPPVETTELIPPSIPTVPGYPVAPPEGGGTPYYPYPVGCCFTGGGGTPPSTPPVSTPEPSGLALMALGLLTIFTIRAVKR